MQQAIMAISIIFSIFVFEKKRKKMKNKTKNVERKPNHVIVSSIIKVIADKSVTIVLVCKGEVFFTMSDCSLDFIQITYDNNTEISSVIGTNGHPPSNDSAIGRKNDNMASVRNIHPKVSLILNYLLQFLKLIIKMALRLFTYYLF